MPWRLEPGQAPVGYVKPVAESENQKELHKMETSTTEESKDD